MSKYKPGDIVILTGYEKSRMPQWLVGFRFVLQEKHIGDIYTGWGAENEFGSWYIVENEFVLDELCRTPLWEALK